MDKFQRNYLLSIDENDTDVSFMSTGTAVFSGSKIVVEPPFTIEFDIVRSIMSTANTSQIRVYNLSKDNRNKIYKNGYDNLSYKGIQLRAGYGNNLSLIFKGNVKEAHSMREGLNHVTTIQCYDGGLAFATAEVNKSFPKDTPHNAILEDTLKTLKGVDVGRVGDFTDTIKRGATISGKSQNVLREMSGDAFFVDLEKSYVLKDEECITGQMSQITSSTGLLGTPMREGPKLKFSMIFEPRLMIGQLISLQSLTAENFNGDYKVMAINHKGTISGGVCGTAITTVDLWRGTKALKELGA